jgi:ketosteroid isomerase-like protein
MEHVRRSPAAPLDEIAGHLERAFNSGDATALASLYADDATLMPPNQSAVSGKLEIESWFARALQRLRTVRILPVESKIMGDVAFQVGTFTSMPKSIDDSSSVQESDAGITAKYVLVLRRVAGEWKIQYDIWNLDQ